MSATEWRVTEAGGAGAGSPGGNLPPGACSRETG